MVVMILEHYALCRLACALQFPSHIVWATKHLHIYQGFICNGTIAAQWMLFVTTNDSLILTQLSITELSHWLEICVQPCKPIPSDHLVESVYQIANIPIVCYPISPPLYGQ